MKKPVFPICVTLLAAILLSTGTMAAAPSFFGYTGLIVIPTTDALSKGEYSAGGFAIDLESGVDSNVYAANLGVAESTEIGFARIKPDGASGETSVNAKHAFQQETETRPAIAAGIIDITGETESTVYIVLSKAVREQNRIKYGEITAPRVYVGAGGGQLDGFFGGLSASLGDRLLLMAEYDSSNVNFGARLAVSEEIRVHAAVLDGDDVALGASFTKLF